MGGAVDSTGEARHDDRTLLPEIIGELPGEPAGRRRSVACTDDRDQRPIEQLEIALHRQQWRSVIQLGERSRIKALPKDEIASTECLDRRDLGLGIPAVHDPRSLAPTSRGEVRNGFQSGARRSEAGDQLAVGYRPRFRANGPVGAGRPNRNSRGLFSYLWFGAGS